jgi:3-deoxy-D-manno-octulosonic-acid transferase
VLLGLAAPFHPKARAWVKGRKDIFKRLERIQGNAPLVWMHCASLGEFEQGRPVLESIRKQYPNYKILLTFFSPSGFEHQKNYSGADFVEYLPMDGPRTAKRFIECVDPKLVIFVKYEFWFYFLKKLHYRNIPLLLISAYFRPEMSFFRWYGKLPRKMLSRFDHIFVQDDQSQRLLHDVDISSNVEVAGDTRFDRVVEIAASNNKIEGSELFPPNSRSIIVGSSWPADEQLWASVRPWTHSTGIRLIVVPHELSSAHIDSLFKLFPGAQKYSEILQDNRFESDVLIVDRIGLLAKLYRFGWVNFVGGGFNAGGVHNVLEAAVFGRPVITGPRIEKYREALELSAANGSISLPIDNAAEALQKLLAEWDQDESLAIDMGRNAGEYVRKRTGAVQRILAYIQENRLLTN